ncbi:MAG: phage tail protein I [Synergistaceae bacterium]|nr:phage tail protein I [Synergistaceae bacterium]
MAKDLYGLSLADIIPSSIANDPQVLAMIAALDPEISGVSRDIREALIYSRIDELPESVIDLLAWQFHADFYEPVTMDLQTKRNIVKSTIMVHRKKGTPWAVRRLFSDLGFQMEYSEWFSFGGKPYVDRLKVWLGDGFDFSKESRDLIMLAWNLTKSTRTHLESLSLGLWFEDEFGRILESIGDGDDDGIRLNAPQSFLDLYPWPGLRYGEFWYGDTIRYGDFAYGDGTKYGGGSKTVQAQPTFEPVRFGEFRYGDGTKYGDGTEIEGDLHPTRYYGEDEPDLLGDFAGTLSGLEEEYAVPSVYGEIRYGAFIYGAPPGVQDGGGNIVIRRPLIYGRFNYGDGMPRYGEVVYGDFSYGGSSVRYGGEVLKEAI